MDQAPYESFCGLTGENSSYDRSEIVVVPVPFDLTSTWIKGSDRGPSAILGASRSLEFYDIETNTEVYKRGIHTLKNIESDSPEGIVEAVESKVGSLIDDGKFTVVIGGNHTVSVGEIRAYLERDSSISVLHLDAHTDLRDIYLGSRLNHACAMARVRERTDNVVSVGIRSMDAEELPRVLPGNIFYAKDIVNSNSWYDQVVERLSARVFVNIDLDVLDPSVMPSTGTPEPGGLDWYLLTGLLKRVSQEREVAGFDIVELCPSENRSPDFLAAKIIYKLLSYVFS